MCEYVCDCLKNVMITVSDRYQVTQVFTQVTCQLLTDNSSGRAGALETDEWHCACHHMQPPPITACSCDSKWL